MITEVELSGIKYKIRCITYGNQVMFSQTSYNFEAEINSVFVPLRCHCSNELVRDLCCIMGLDPVKELANIAFTEIKAELFEIVYNTSFKKQSEIASDCKNVEELLAAAAHDTVFAAWLANFGSHSS